MRKHHFERANKYPLLPKLNRRGRTKKKHRRHRKTHCVCGRPAVSSDGSCGQSIDCVLQICKIKARRNMRRKEKQYAKTNIVIEKERVYTPMEHLQRRNRFNQGLKAHLASLNVDLVRPLKVCTGILRQGEYCITCKTVHVESLKHQWKTGDAAIDNYILKNDAKYMALRREAQQSQLKLLAKSAKKLKDRRREREKQLNLPPNFLLKDYSLGTGGEIDPEYREAVLESLKLHGMDVSSFVCGARR